MIAIMRTTLRGRQRLTDREGKILVSYPDPATGGEPWTIGVGHTGFLLDGTRVRKGMKITAQDADDLLSSDLLKFEKALCAALTRVPADHQFDAFVSITHNVGVGFAKSTAIRRFNAGESDENVVAAIRMYNRPPMIRKRRETEVSQFLTPYSGA